MSASKLYSNYTMARNFNAISFCEFIGWNITAAFISSLFGDSHKNAVKTNNRALK